MPGFHKNSLLLIFILPIATHCIQSEDDLDSQNNSEIVEKSGESSESEDSLPVAFQVSGCGGFQPARSSGGFQPARSGTDLLPESFIPSGRVPLSDPEFSYCDGEVLHWYFDPELSKLHLNHRRVALNCCGEHSVEVSKDEDTYVVTEMDEPLERCRCNCVFDYVSAFTVEETTIITLVLELHVTDVTPSPRTIYKGEIDLQEGEGAIVLNEQPVMGCP